MAENMPSNTGEPGIRIGAYQDCQHITSGVTAELYRSNSRALKVITEHNMAPHHPGREVRILESLRREQSIITLLDTFRDQEQRLVLVFPYMPLTLAAVLDSHSASSSPVPDAFIRSLFADLFSALLCIHAQGIIHRDIKPSNLLLGPPSRASTAAATTTTTTRPDLPELRLADFGTAWHPALSAVDEPPDRKILDIGTGPYRAPEVLFGDVSYGPAVDMWGAGALLAECCRKPRPRPLFESRAAHEDGNQLGLILSIFKTLGSPTRETWPDAAHFRTPPFEMYRTFPRREWDEVLPEVEVCWRGLVARLVRFDAGRATAEEALQHLVDIGTI